MNIKIIKDGDEFCAYDADRRPHKTNSVICLSCLYDWQAVYPENADINNLECPLCNKYNSIKFDLITSRKLIKFLFKKSDLKLDEYVKFTYELRQTLKND
jgi:hypothetical protein